MPAKKITIDLEAGTAQFIQGVDKAGHSLKHLGESAEESHGFLSKFKEGFEMAGGFEAFKSGLELAKKGLEEIKQAFEEVGQIGRNADKLGISAEQMSRFQHAANATHTDVSALTTGMDHLNRQIGLVASGDKSAAKVAEAFQRLGINAKELAGLSPDEAFTKVADALGKTASTFDRAAISQEIFGRGGKELIPLLGNLKGLMAESDDIGFTTTAENIEAAEKEEKKLAATTDTIKGLFMDLATSKWATELIEHIQAVAKEWHYMMAEPISQATIDADEARIAQLNAKIREVNERMKAAHEQGDSAGLLAAEQEGLKILKEKAEAVKTYNGHAAAGASNYDANAAIQASRAIHQQINAQTQQVAAAQKVKDAEDAAAAAAAAAAKKQLAAHKEISAAMAGLRSEIGVKSGSDPFAKYAEEAKKMKDAGASAADLAAYQKLVEALKKLTAEKKHQAEMDAAQKKRAEEAKRIWAEAETPLQKYRDRLKELQDLLKNGALSEAQYTQAAAKAWADKARAEKAAHDVSKKAGMEQHRFNFDMLAKPLAGAMPKLHPEGSETNGILKQTLTIHKQQQTYAQNWDQYLRQIWQTLTNSAGTTPDTTAAI